MGVSTSIGLQVSIVVSMATADVIHFLCCRRCRRHAREIASHCSLRRFRTILCSVLLRKTYEMWIDHFQVAGSQTLKASGKPVKVAESDVDVSRIHHIAR